MMHLANEGLIEIVRTRASDHRASDRELGDMLELRRCRVRPGQDRKPVADADVARCASSPTHGADREGLGFSGNVAATSPSTWRCSTRRQPQLVELVRGCAPRPLFG